MSEPTIITSTETYCDGANVITVDFSNTASGFGMRMSVNGQSDHGWTWHNPPRGGGTELVEGNDAEGYYAWFGPFWEWHFPIDTVVKLVKLTKD
jgi:hypothetical protein